MMKGCWWNQGIINRLEGLISKRVFIHPLICVKYNPILRSYLVNETIKDIKSHFHSLSPSRKEHTLQYWNLFNTAEHRKSFWQRGARMVKEQTFFWLYQSSEKWRILICFILFVCSTHGRAEDQRASRCKQSKLFPRVFPSSYAANAKLLLSCKRSP